MMANASIRWKITPDFELLWHEWDNEYVVYHSGSGDTHLLNFLAAHLLQYLTSHTASMSEIIAHLISACQLDVDDDFQDSIENMMKEFSRLGLVEESQE